MTTPEKFPTKPDAGSRPDELTDKDLDAVVGGLGGGSTLVQNAQISQSQTTTLSSTVKKKAEDSQAALASNIRS